MPRYNVIWTWLDDAGNEYNDCTTVAKHTQALALVGELLFTGKRGGTIKIVMV